MNTIKSSLLIHGNEVQSVFETLGSNENALSYSLGYVLSKSPHLLRTLIKTIYRKKINYSNVIIKLQEHGDDAGFTDFEITINNEFYFVVEAKKGWIKPDLNQLRRYLPRFQNFQIGKKMFVVLTDWKEEHFVSDYRTSFYNVPIRAISWANVIDAIASIYSECSNQEKFLLDELRNYLKEIVYMENQESNRTYVVSLSNKTPSWCKFSWIDIVVKKHFYFFPQGKNWPKVPPNYMAFRYEGRLQSIHHVEHYEVVPDVHKYIPEIRRGRIKKHFLLWLGEGFEPRKELPNGTIWSNGRYWCMLDTLFTSKTVKQARDISKKRYKSC